MSDVPHLRFPEFTEEWETLTIADACFLYNGRAYKQEELLPIGKYRVLRVGNFFTNDSWYYSDLELDEQKTIVKGDLLYAWSASFGPRFWTGEKAIYHYHIWKVIPKEHIDKGYLYHFLYKDSLIIKSRTQGGTMVHVTKGDMEKRPISFPCLEEQKKIAKLLSLLNDRIATQNKIIEKLESLIKGLRQRLLSPKQGWTSYRFDELCQIKSGYSGTQVSFQTAYKVSRIETISKHCVDMSRTGFVKTIPQEYKLNVGDILFSNINSVQYIGNTAYIDKEYGLYHGMNLLRIIPNSQLVFPRFIHLLLCTDRLLRHFQSVCNKAVSQASINQTSLGKTIISIPSYGEQQHICRIIGSIERKLDIEINLLKMLQNQKQHLLRQMFI